jgi:hypothetical protein
LISIRRVRGYLVSLAFVDLGRRMELALDCA